MSDKRVNRKISIKGFQEMGLIYYGTEEKLDYYNDKQTGTTICFRKGQTVNEIETKIKVRREAFLGKSSQ